MASETAERWSERFAAIVVLARKMGLPLDEAIDRLFAENDTLRAALAEAERALSDTNEGATVLVGDIKRKDATIIALRSELARKDAALREFFALFNSDADDHVVQLALDKLADATRQFCKTIDADGGQCLRDLGHSGAHDLPFSRAEQAANHAHAASAYDAALRLWKDNGRLGPPPPRPVPPHT